MKKRQRYQKGTPEQERARDMLRHLSVNKHAITPDHARQLYDQAGWERPHYLKEPNFTMDRIRELAIHDVLIATCLRAAEANLLTTEEALIMMVVSLAEKSASLQERVLFEIQHSANPRTEGQRPWQDSASD